MKFPTLFFFQNTNKDIKLKRKENDRISNIHTHIQQQQQQLERINHICIFLTFVVAVFSIFG
jgi:hypothetical protein